MYCGTRTFRVRNSLCGVQRVCADEDGQQGLFLTSFVLELGYNASVYYCRAFNRGLAAALLQCRNKGTLI